MGFQSKRLIQRLVSAAVPAIIAIVSPRVGGAQAVIRGYLYDDSELESWAPKIRDLGGQVRETHVLLNNCYRNYAQLNARQLAHLVRTA